MQVHVPESQWGQINWNTSVGSRERFISGPCQMIGGSCSKTLNFSKGFSKALLKVKCGRGMVSCYKLLGVGILCSCSCPCRSGHNVSINLQDKSYSLFCNFSSLDERTLKGQSPENRQSPIFQTIGKILLQKVQTQHDLAQATKHKD